MRNALPAAAAVVAASLTANSAAIAADLPVPEMPKAGAAPAPPSYRWGGCYVGINAGGGTTGANFGSTVEPGTYLLPPDPATVAAGAAVGSYNGTGVVVGGQAGCNMQTGMWVIGVEADFDSFRSVAQFNNNTNTLANGNAFTVAQSLTTNYLATVRPRIGIGADRNFAYITGGVAFTNASYAEPYSDTNTPPGAGTATASKSMIGWTAGAGWEYAATEHLTLRAEYLVAGFGTINATGAITAPGGLSNTLRGSSDVTIQMLRGGINVKF